MPRTNRDPRLPQTYPGCWKDAEFMARYKTVDMQIRREGAYGSDERERARAKRRLIERVIPMNNCYNCSRPAQRFVVRKVSIEDRLVCAFLRWCGKC